MSGSAWPSNDELRYSGVELAVRGLWTDFEQELSRTRRGRLVLRLARLWARLPRR
ncbi:hypothetical protein [Streptomyces sp. NPDC001508]|uniref:hypothetical protein n=1 Tax=Streptomyces sp. NPDC001508 TaxID=3154656 RepID=UPI00332DDE21